VLAVKGATMILGSGDNRRWTAEAFASDPLWREAAPDTASVSGRLASMMHA